MGDKRGMLKGRLETCCKGLELPRRGLCRLDGQHLHFLLLCDTIKCSFNQNNFSWLVTDFDLIDILVV